MQVIYTGGINAKEIAEFVNAIYNLEVKRSFGINKFLSLYYLSGNDRASLYEFEEGRKA